MTVIRPMFSPMELIRFVARLAQSRPSEITGPNRMRELVRARAVIIKVMDEKGLSFSSTGRWLNRNRATVRHHLETFNYNFADDMVARGMLKAAREQFGVSV